MLLYVNSVDFPDAYYSWTPHFRRIVVPNDASIQQVVDWIKQAAIRHGTIRRIVINSHGLPGEVYIGQGLNINNVDLLSGLRPYMQPMVSEQEINRDTGILIDACLVASGSGRNQNIGTMVCEPGTGYEFLWKMAIAINNKVLAAFNVQFSPGAGGSDSSGIEGPHVLFGPRGVLKVVDRAYTGDMNCG